jgi:hypothetical protein
MQNNNILSYFIKDIKNPLTLEKYIQINNNSDIKIVYDSHFVLYHYNKYYNYIYNYNKNISKSDCFNSIFTRKKAYNKKTNYKRLFYKKDNKIKYGSLDFIDYKFIYNKYLYKINISYRIIYSVILNIKIKYYNKSKYMFCNKTMSSFNKYTSQILIMNKYEIHYISRFFYLYFD